MLPQEEHGQNGPLLILLHWLGGGAQTWREVGGRLARRGVRVVALDLPGFGRAADQPAFDVTTAANAVIETVRQMRSRDAAGPWLIGGHSMGGKIAQVVARRALDGEPGLDDLRGLLLVSPSTASPEPIKEERRAELLEIFGEANPDPAQHRRAAEKWIDGNAGKVAFTEAVRERAVQGVLDLNPRALRAWFLHGSKEDWSDRVGVLSLPALIFVGGAEASLGEEAQRILTLPHLPEAELIVLEGAKHLSPLDRPGELVEQTTQFLAGLGLPLRTPEAQPGGGTEGLMHSDHTSPKTLEVMTNRLGRAQDWNHRPEFFTAAEFQTARALAEAIVPNAGFDLAARVDAQLAACMGDGWRYALLPADPEAWRRGLLSLDMAAKRAHDVGFLALRSDQQADLLQEVADRKIGQGLLGALHLGSSAHALPAEQFQRWFEDARAEYTRFYMADPRTMDRIGYTGFADDLGFTQIQLAQQEEFER